MHSSREFSPQLKKKVQTWGCSSTSANVQTSPFWVPSSQIFTKKVHFVYNFTTFIRIQDDQAIKSTDLTHIKACAFRSTPSLAGYRKLYMNCWYPALAIWASSYMDLLLTNWLRGTTVLLQDAWAHYSSCQGRTGRSISRLLRKLWKLKLQKYGKFEVLPFRKYSPPQIWLQWREITCFNTPNVQLQEKWLFLSSARLLYKFCILVGNKNPNQTFLSQQ